MRKRLVVGLSLVALAGAACTDGALGDGADNDPVPRETLLLGTQAGPIVVEIPSGSMLFERKPALNSLAAAAIVFVPEPTSWASEMKSIVS